MKTGTPMRLDGRTIHFDLCERQEGEEGWHHFSFLPGVSRLETPQRLREVILRPRITLDGLVPFVPQLANFLEQGQLADEVKETIEVEVKYGGYIARERQAAEKARHLEDSRIAGHYDYLSIQSLSTEARQTLDRIRPATIGQASRIPGISPSDINILLILMGR